ncbi:putative FAD-linked oxidoreductase [Aliiroseovarius sp. xm-m-379]|nr:putative FAD-linked oxidoreductase [Aliiroseovarius sp. xm-d-517]NRP23721.1 putative FAD-linked oxidoreductase [Aliiroseovarius sp. xm-m-379]NRP29032.1 putative FAD-linked oxidoreductase [Aliiroseovarius sp. xm-m-314]NRP32520.1 putative FAD-linked oxidoreductase [Aliiroseovarius sp. xm-a-104]NRP41053.1 putative FAD-linked oxidoreductase [Aliiroseovarius sp. xm-m-339-2]NRP43757.1 putative FAD-linked oxidoreductase [Aliiroseovarius sp. xm-m-378]NRP48941.1 putative FAD-linked oxidoreductase [
MMTPETEADLAEILAGARASWRIQGGGTRDIGAPVEGEMLSVAGLTGVTLYEPGALTLVAQAGTPLAEIEALLASEGQRLAFEPSDFQTLLGGAGASTIGGVVASNSSGPRRIQAGAVRDHCLGVRFVDGCGRVIKNGGRVMKNVTGYDLVKLLCGSWGTLGVLSEVSLKVQALPEAEVTLVGKGLRDAEAVARLSVALGSPYDVTGAACVGGETRVRVEGLAASVAYRARALQQGVLRGFDLVEGEASSRRWEELRQVAPFADKPGAVWRISVKPSDGPVLVRALASIEPEVMYDWGGGLVWMRVDEGQEAFASLIRSEVNRLGGHALLVRASAATRAKVPVFPPEPAPLAAISAALRKRFDPNGVLNSGLMGG